jgi:hypothetical protein
VLTTTIEGGSGFPSACATHRNSESTCERSATCSWPPRAARRSRPGTDAHRSVGVGDDFVENGLLVATVLLNVGRDIGGFVNEARGAVARGVTLPVGYYLGWSGRSKTRSTRAAPDAGRAARARDLRAPVAYVSLGH